MSNTSDDPKKDPARSTEPKRPHATLDLKAIEIKAADPASASAKAGAATTATTAAAAGTDKAATEKTAAGKSSDAPASTAATAKPTTASATAAAAASPSASASTTSPPAGSSPADAKATSSTPPGRTQAPAGPMSSTPPPHAAPPARAGGGFGRLVSHTFAGILGGFLALVGADHLRPHLEQLGLPLDASHQRATEQLQSRLAKLEQATKATGQDGQTAKLSEALAASTARIAALEGMQQQWAALGADHEQLRTRTLALATDLDALKAAAAAANKAAATTQPSAPDPRIDRLEAELAALTAAVVAPGSMPAGASPAPDLTAINGRIADLEAALATQVEALRKSVGVELDTRMGKASETAEAARSGTVRIDRELADVKNESTRLGQRIDALKVETDGVREAVRQVHAQAGTLASGLDALKGDLAARLAATAKPGDITAAVAPVTAKVAALEKSVEGVVATETQRKANAERVVLSLELANLKRAVDRGLPYAEELTQARRTAGSSLDLSALEPYGAHGVPTLAQLKSDFQPLTHAVIAASRETAEGGVFDQLIAGARSMVHVRKVTHGEGDTSVEAVVARMETALDNGRLGEFATLAQGLPAKAQAPAADFFKKVAARGAVDAALKAVEAQLKSSLGSSATPPAAAPAPAVQ